jgi:hypothetical protein
MAAGGPVIMVPRSSCPFVLTTEAAFTVEGVWLIRADFSFHKTAKGPLRALVNQARLAVMAALTRQALRGWSLGANTVRVRLMSGGQWTDFPLPAKTLTSNLLHLLSPSPID